MSFNSISIFQKAAVSLSFILATLQGSADITERITSATLENTIILDADGADLNPGTNRHTATTNFECFFEVTAPQFGHTADYRIAYRLRDSSGTALPMVNGDPAHPTLGKRIAYTPSQRVSLNRFAIFPATPVPSKTINFTALPDPVATLDPKEDYTVFGELQRSDDNGATWNTVVLIAPESESTDPANFLHLTNTVHGDAPVNVRASLRDFSWTKRHALDGSDNHSAFEASVELFGARYDDFNSTFQFADVTYTLDFDLIESGTNRNISLENDGVITTDFTLLNRGILNSTPITFTRLIEASLVPLEQLNSASHTYFIRCSVSHIETPPSTVHSDVSCDFTPTQLLHFNGNLLFDDFVTTFDDLVQPPIPNGGNLNRVSTFIRIPQGAGHFPAQPSYSFGNGAPLDVDLLNNGNAVLTAGNQQVYLSEDPAINNVICDFGGIQVSFSSVDLSLNAATSSDYSIRLPQGLTLFENTDVNSFRGTPILEDNVALSLDETLCPEAAITRALGANAAVADESHPLLFQVSQIEVSDTGIDFDATGIKYAHADTYQTLADLVEQDSPTKLPEEFRDRISNDRYLLNVTSVEASLSFSATPDGSARISTSIEIDKQAFSPHFPLGAKISHTEAGNLIIEGGFPKAGSSLNGKPEVSVGYSATCSGDECTEDIEPREIDFLASGESIISTPGGGLFATGPVDNFEGSLIWGLRSPTQYAHRTASFPDADFYMPGYQLYASDNVLRSKPVYKSIASDQSAALLLLSGYNQDPDSPELHLFSESPYRTGKGSLAGMNFEVTDGGFDGASRLGGVEEDYPYELLQDEGNGGSKYYARLGGISGRQIAAKETFGKNTSLHGFPVEFTSFQLTFLDNDNENPACDSWVNGNVRTIGPYAEWSQSFDGLRFDCYGEPGAMNPNLEEADGKQLVFWNSEFDLKALRFGRNPVLDKDGNELCPKKFTAKLIAGVETGAAHISTPLIGSLAFCPDGSLSTAAEPIEGVDSQLRIPASIPLSGPNKDYTLVTASKLRFSNPLVGGNTGFVTFAATIDIPYFVDLQVQAITSATGAPEDGEPQTFSELYLTPGWTDDDGETFFTRSDFDAEHRGYPQGISLFDYRVPESDSPHLITARQDLFGFIPLEYPLLWDFNTRRFQSASVQEKNIFITKMKHEVEWMDAKFANISFGAKYDGLPVLKISNFLNGQIDGAANAISQQISDLGKEVIDDALDALDKVLEDSAEQLINPIVDAAADEINLTGPIDQVRSTITQLHNTSATYDVFRDEMEELLNNPGGPRYTADFSDPFSEHLETIADTTETAHSMITQVDDALKKIILGIDNIVHGVTTADGKAIYLPVLPDDVDIQGILHKQDGQRNIVRSLTQRLLVATVEDDVRAIIEPLITAGTGSLNDQINASLEEIEPTLDQISSVLLQIREVLVKIQQKVDIVEDNAAEAADLAKRIRDAVAEAKIDGSFDEIILPISQRAWSRFLQAEAALGLGPDVTLPMNEIEGFLEEFNTNSFVEDLKDELRFELLASDLVSNIRFAVRQQLYDVQQRITSAFQSVLAQISEVMKKAISEALAPLDDYVSGFLGSVSDYMGSGEITGYAEINGDSLRKLRLEAKMELKIPKELKLHVYMEILAYSSEDNFVQNGCIKPGEKAVEVKVGASDVAIDWISEIRADFEVKVSLKDFPDDDIDFPVPIGVSGKFEMTGGSLDFQTFEMFEFGATIAIGLEECYLGAKARARFSSYEMAAGIFFGRTCTIDPLVFVDPDVGDVIEPGTTFTGAYVYGEAWIPISEVVLGVPASCMFRIDAGVGAGAFYFAEGPTFGGKMLLGVSGEALCLVSIRGEIKMTLASQAGSLKGSGKGTFKAKVGACPFCVKFKKTVGVKYNNGSWSMN